MGPMVCVLMLTAMDDPQHYEQATAVDRAANYALRSLPQVVQRSILWHCEQRGVYFSETELVDYSNFDGAMQIIVKRWRGNPLPYPTDPRGAR